MTKRLLPVLPENIYDMMGYVDKYVKPAYDTGNGERTWGTLVAQLLLGQVILWLSFDNDKVVGAGTTEIIDYSGYRMVHVITYGGDNGAGFEDFHVGVENYARGVGARDIQFWGRKGWSRSINKVTGTKGEKYREVYRVFSMEINYNDDSTPEPSHEVHELVGSGTP